MVLFSQDAHQQHENLDLNLFPLLICSVKAISYVKLTSAVTRICNSRNLPFSIPDRNYVI